MSIESDARAEAEHRYPARYYQISRPTFLEGALWAASRPIEVTDEMVERAARAIHEAAEDRNVERTELWEPPEDGPALPLVWDALHPYQQDNYRADARAALEAALGGRDESGMSRFGDSHEG